MQTNPLNALLEPFRVHLQRRDLAAATIRVYLHDLKIFGRWIAQVHGAEASPDDLGTADLAAFRRHLLQERDQKPATVNRRINALRAFFGWRRTKTKGRKANPALALRFVRRAGPRRPRSLRSAEILALLRAADSSAHDTDLRNEALLQLMLQAGLRVSEVVALRRRDLHLQARAGTALVRSGKGLKQREVPLNATARRALSNYLDHVGERALEDAVFLSKRGTPLSVRAAQDVVSRLAKKANIMRLTVSAHTLRHTFAINFLKSSPSKLVELAALMGHDSLDTTALYLRPSEEDLAEEVENSPLNVLGN